MDEQQPQPLPKPRTFAMAASLTVAGLILFGGGLAVGMRYFNQPLPIPSAYQSSYWPNTMSPSSYDYVSTSPTTSSSPRPTPKVTTYTDGITWLNAPEKITKLGIFENSPVDYPYNESPNPEADNNPEDSEYTTFYRVGSDNGKDLILVSPAPDGPGSQPALFLVKDGPDRYRLLRQHSTDWQFNSETGEYTGWAMNSKVTLDETTQYASIAFQTKLTIDTMTFVTESQSTMPFGDIYAGGEAQDSQFQLIGKTDYGNLYRYNSLTDALTDENMYALEEILLKRPNFTVEVYSLPLTFMTDDGVPQVTWADGSINKDSYRTDGNGSCGRSGRAIIADALVARDLKATGTTKSGEQIYEFTTTNNPLVKLFYEGYARPWEGRPDAIVSIDEYLKRHGLFAYKDALGHYILFSSTVYGIQAECGKPVIYLYPTQTTQVDVQVDAEITQSEPAYNTGWRVVAEPNGQLTTTDGSTYDSLFWEGIGDEYPAIREGFIVRHADLHTTLVDHLTRLGLNLAEQADFLEFWLPKMPTTPYVRLTWFGTTQMNRLAPLHITPTPDTVHRIFLDFEGLETPIDLEPQTLRAPARKGFTVIEWGGLLRP